jgi:hypothetical protein
LKLSACLAVLVPLVSVGCVEPRASEERSALDAGVDAALVTPPVADAAGPERASAPEAGGPDAAAPMVDAGSSPEVTPMAPDAAAPDVAAPPPDAGGVWKPAPGTTWQWQLTGTIDTTVDVQMYDVDLFDVPGATLETLRAQGRIVICYFSAGSHENWRADAAKFPSEALGRPLDGWPGERWLDVRSEGVRAVMKARLDLAVSRKCHGVEPDNIDGYTNETGFPLAGADQLDYNRFLAREAHARGLSIGLKNDLDQVGALEADFDWALDEQCLEFDECDLLTPFIRAGKAVFHVEYGAESLAERVCARTKPLKFSTLIKKLNLDAWRVACP